MISNDIYIKFILNQSLKWLHHNQFKGFYEIYCYH